MGKSATQKKELVKPTINFVYLEDVPVYCHHLKQELSQHASLNNRLQIHPVIYLEQAYSLLKKGNVQGLILDLHVSHAPDSELTRLKEQRLELPDDVPDDYAGIGLILQMQENFSFIQRIKKAFITGYPFSFYKYYYDRIKGPKEIIEKNNLTITAENTVNWIKNNFKL